MKHLIIALQFVLLFFFLLACSNSGPVSQNQKQVRVNVKTTQIRVGDINEEISLNGQTTYLKKYSIVSPISGYVTEVNIIYGEEVKKGDILFKIETKENKALQNTSYAENRGLIEVKAPADGIIDNIVINEPGGFVMEGSTLADLMENKDLMIQVFIPFDYNFLAKPGKQCRICLQDSSSLDGEIVRVLPIVNRTDQTQKVLVKPYSDRTLPEFLNVTVKFISGQHIQTLLVNKKALMTNEMQTNFWVMKLINDSLAIKIPVTKGLVNDSMAEISSRNLKSGDIVITEGAYGLADSTIVNLEK